MWQDMGVYWAWRGEEPPKGSDHKPPTEKRLEYATIHYQNWHPLPMTMTICCGVFDDKKYTEQNRNEIKWHEDQGAEITRPSNGIFRRASTRPE